MGTIIRDRRLAAKRQGVIAALDVGSAKITCLIAKPEAARADTGRPVLRVIGVGHQLSRGIARGCVVDVAAAENAIRAAVDAAETMAGTYVSEVFLNLSTHTLASHHVALNAPVPSGEVTREDVRRLLARAAGSFDLGERVRVHALPMDFSVDGHRGIKDPRGMFGESLGVSLHILTAAPGPVRNLTTCVERCHLEVAGLVASPYAAGLAALVEDERDLGAALIDLGGGTTSLSVFFQNRLVYTHTQPLGAQHVTTDIARGLSTPLQQAERMKILFGSAGVAPADHDEMIDAPQVGEEGEETAHHIPRAFLNQIIQPRVEETLELMRDALERSGYATVAGRRVVLTGGAAQLTGMREAAARVLGRQVRIARPLGLMGLPSAMTGPAFAVAAGLLLYPGTAPADVGARAAGRSESGESWLGFNGIRRWLSDVF